MGVTLRYLQTPYCNLYERRPVALKPGKLTARFETYTGLPAPQDFENEFDGAARELTWRILDGAGNEVLN
jgi:hypothetical protein